MLRRRIQMFRGSYDTMTVACVSSSCGSRLRAVSLVGLLVCVALSGCIPYHYSSSMICTEKFLIQSPKPEQYFIRVPDNRDYAVPSDGRITINYTEKRSHWQAEFMDANWLGDWCSTCNVKAIFVMRERRVVRKIRIKDLGTPIHRDEDGFWVVQVEQK